MRFQPTLLALAPAFAVAAAFAQPAINGRGPADLHGIIPLEVAVEKEPSAGQEILVQARVAPGSFPDAQGCPVFAWVVDETPGAKSRAIRLKPVGKNDKARRIRQRRDGTYWTTEGVRFQLAPEHAGKTLRLQVRPSRGGQLDRTRTYFIGR